MGLYIQEHIWPYRKVNYGIPRIISQTYIEEPTSTMLYNRFQFLWLLFRIKTFEDFLPCMGMGVVLSCDLDNIVILHGLI